MPSYPSFLTGRRFKLKKGFMKRMRARRATTSRAAGGGALSAFSGYRRPIKSRTTASENTGVVGTLTRWNAFNPFPDRYNFRNMEYIEILGLASGAAGVVGTTYTFNLSSLYQPRSGGHQPTFYDQLTPLYNFYRVTSVRIVCTFNALAANTCFPIWAIKNSSDTWTISGLTVPVQAENPNISGIMLNIYNCPRVVNTFTGSISEIDGLTRLQSAADDSRYVAQVTGSPSAIPKFEIGAGDWNGDSSTVKVCVQIFFSGYFWGRTTQNYS